MQQPFFSFWGTPWLGRRWFIGPPLSREEQVQRTVYGVIQGAGPDGYSIQCIILRTTISDAEEVRRALDALASCGRVRRVFPEESGHSTVPLLERWTVAHPSEGGACDVESE